MSIKQLTLLNLEYNHWANVKYASLLRAKPGELLHKEFPSSFTSKSYLENAGNMVVNCRAYQTTSLIPINLTI